MPPRIEAGNRDYGRKLSSEEMLSMEDMNYEYLHGNLRPGSPMHEMLLSEILIRVKEATDASSQNHDKMGEVDNMMTAFIPLKEADLIRKKKDPTAPVPIVIPQSFAAFKTVHTQYVSYLAAQDEIHRFAGRGPEDTISSMISEKLILQQTQDFGELEALSYQAKHFLKYSFGAVTPVWEKEYGYKTSQRPKTVADPVTGAQIETDETESFRERIVKKQGNKVHNIDPYRIIVDPNVCITKTEDMEYVGFCATETRMKVISREAEDKRWINGKYLKRVMDNNTAMVSNYFSHADNAGGEERAKRGQARQGEHNNRVDIIYLYMLIIPSEYTCSEGGRDYKLSDVEVPEWWMFAVAGDTFILYAEPMDLDHNTPPILIAAPESDGFGTPTALMEITKGTQIATDFMWNTLAAFYRKHLRGRFIGDPYRMNMKDAVLGADFIRTERTIFGDDIRKFFMPLTMPDVTGNNIPNIGFLNDITQRATGATDALQGVMRAQGERRSAEEARGSRLGALSRIEETVLHASMQCIDKLGSMMLSQTCQFLDQPGYVEVLGRWEEELMMEYGKQKDLNTPGFAQDWQGYFPYDPRQLNPYANIVPMSVTKRGEEFFEVWTQLYAIILGNPIIANTLDHVRIFKHIARLGGAKNVSDFILPPNMRPIVVPDEKVKEMQAKGQVEDVEKVAA